LPMEFPEDVSDIVIAVAQKGREGIQRICYDAIPSDAKPIRFNVRPYHSRA